MAVAHAARARLGLPPGLLARASDERLVAQIRASGPGARTAFEVLYERHHRGILAFCRHMLGSREEGEDAVQHVFVSAHRAMLADERPLRLRAWLYAIARNRCLSVLRARREYVVLDDAEPAPASTAGLAAQVQQRDDLRTMVADVQALPEDQRAALVLFELGDQAHDEIAEVLGVRHDKVKALVFQARESLIRTREARGADCGAVQEQLAVLRGGALRRSTLRRHVEHCGACGAFSTEVRRQRAALAAVLPVVPTLALKGSVVGSVFGAAGVAGAGAAGSSVVAGAGGTGASAAAVAGAAAGAKGLVAKVLIAAAVTGGAGAGGYVAVDRTRSDGETAGPVRSAPAAGAAAGAGPNAPAVTAASATQPTGSAARRNRSTGSEPGRRRASAQRPSRGTGPAQGDGSATSSPSPPTGAGAPAATGGGAAEPATGGGGDGSPASGVVEKVPAGRAPRLPRPDRGLPSVEVPRPGLPTLPPVASPPDTGSVPSAPQLPATPTVPVTPPEVPGLGGG